MSKSKCIGNCEEESKGSLKNQAGYQAVMLPGLAEIVELANIPAVTALANILSIGSVTAGLAIAATRAFRSRSSQPRGDVTKIGSSVMFTYGTEVVHLTADQADRIFELSKFLESQGGPPDVPSDKDSSP